MAAACPELNRIMQFIDLQAQQRAYKPEIDARIGAVLAHGQYILGPEVAELEQLLAEWVGVRHCLTVGSGTVSLEIALRALGVGPGDEVVTVPFTFISTSEVVMSLGARPVFVDIDPETFNLNPELLEAAITANTKAIIPVGLYGQMAEMERIEEIATRHEIPVIEDAAQSFGAIRNGRKSCGVGMIGSTSFYPAKVFGCYGDGGALFTDDDNLAARTRAISNHGGLKQGEYNLVGLNGRFDTIQAAVLLAKWPHFADELEARNRVAAEYDRRLRNVCRTPVVAAGNTHVYAQYTVRVDNRDAIRSRLQGDGIPTAVHYPKCLHEQPAFAELGHGPGDFPVAERAAREILCLPMHPFLSDDDIERICYGFG